MNLKKIIIGGFLSLSFMASCVPQAQLNKNAQQVAISSGEISGENKAAQIDLEQTRPFVQSAGLPPFNAAVKELTLQDIDIAALLNQEALQQTSYQTQIKADQDRYDKKVIADNLEKSKIQSSLDSLNSRWYCVIGKFLATWNKLILILLALGIIFKGLSVLPLPWGKVFSVAAMVIFGILSAGISVFEDIIGAIAKVIAGLVTRAA